MARILEKDLSIQATGLGYETIRKMLAEKYPPLSIGSVWTR